MFPAFRGPLGVRCAVENGGGGAHAGALLSGHSKGVVCGVGEGPAGRRNPGSKVARKYRLPPQGVFRNKNSRAGLPQASRIDSEVVLLKLLRYFRKPVTPDHGNIWGHLFNSVFSVL